LDAKVQFDGDPMPGGSKATPIQKNLDFNRRGKRQLAYASGRLAMT